MAQGGPTGGVWADAVEKFFFGLCHSYFISFHFISFHFILFHFISFHLPCLHMQKLPGQGKYSPQATIVT